jgi:hypothetical protein
MAAEMLFEVFSSDQHAMALSYSSEVIFDTTTYLHT